MAFIPLDPMQGGSNVYTDAVGTLHAEVIKIGLGTAGTVDGFVSSTMPMPVEQGTYVVDEASMPSTPKLMPVGGEYRSATDTYTDGDAVIPHFDVNGNIKGREQYQPQYEDNTNGLAATLEKPVMSRPSK